jgi:transcription elongation factor GreA
MRTPQRKPGKYTGLKPDPNMTQAKYQELCDKLERLKKISQPAAIKEVKRLALDGDFSENHAYSMAKGRLRGINQRILDIENHLRMAEIIEPNNNTEIVGLGSQVTVEVNGKTRVYQILGSSETDPIRGIISHNSPLGQALINRRVGESVTIETKTKSVVYKIICIK